MQVTPTTSHEVATSGLRRVLLVDDSRAQLRIMRIMLERWGFDVTEAESAPDALDLVEALRPDLVISDWVMPGMSGLEFCRRFRATCRDRFSYFILLTSKTDKEDVAQGLDAGADDFLSKPVSPDELRARINAGVRIVSMQRELSRKNEQVREALAELQQIHDAIESDLRQARTIQQSLVPERCRMIGRSRVSLLLQPCGHVGGDLVGMFAPGFSRLGLYSIDVSGHGITSAMVTARVAGYLSSKFPDQNLALEKRFDRFHAIRAPDQTAQLLNQRLCSDPGVEEYMTMAYLAVDLATGAVRFVQAGHPPALILRATGGIDWLGQGGLPIGLVDDATYEEIRTQLFPGDRLLLYSDGFTEAITPAGAMFGEDGLADLMTHCAQIAEGPELLQDMYWRFCASIKNQDKLEDDVSAALLEFDIVPE